MSNQISNDLIERFEGVIKDRGREFYNYWVKMKEFIGVNNIDFLLVDKLLSEENKIMIITKDSIFEIKVNFKNDQGPWLTTPFHVTESKKKIKEKNYTYSHQFDWEVSHVYDDGSILTYNKEILRQSYHATELDDNLFFYLISL